MWVWAFAVLLLSHQARAQAINPDLIVWTTVNNWIDLRVCVQDCFVGGGGVYPIAQYVGCTTNTCLCRPDTLGAGLLSLANNALSICSGFQDQSTATDLLISYCSAKGHTGIISPTILQTGACTQTAGATATVTAYVTSYVTVSTRSESTSTKAISFESLGVVVAVLSVVFFNSVGLF